MPELSVPLSAYLTVWAFLAVNIATPGPNVLNTIALAIGSGWRAGLGSALGVGLGIGLWCLGMSLGMAALMQRMPGLRAAMTLLACALLVWFASRYLRAAWFGWRHRGRAEVQGRAGAGPGMAFWRSLSVNASNPKALTTWIAVMAMFPAARAGGWDIALLCAGACLLSFSIHTAYALAFSTPAATRVWLRAAPLVNGTVAAVFLGFALRLALTSSG